MADHEPQLQGPKAAPERDLPVSIIGHRTRKYSQYAKRFDQGALIGDVETAAIKFVKATCAD
jgi:hypothetical protein